MKPIKMLGLAALAALLAMAFVGASSAMAEPTILCSNDGESCTEVSHIHESTLAGSKAILLNSLQTVECDVLFLGEAEAGAPLLIEGEFTYTNCSAGCTVEEINGPAAIEVLKEGHETAKITGEGEVHVNCSGINCYYNGEELIGIGKGALLSSETNGSSSTSEKTVTKVKGLFCPSTSKLDITTTPLSATYIQAMKMVCVDVGTNNGFYLAANGSGTACEKEDGTRAGKYELGWVTPGTAREANACVYVGAFNGYYLFRFAGVCLVEDGTRLGRYEEGTTA